MRNCLAGSAKRNREGSSLRSASFVLRSPSHCSEDCVPLMIKHLMPRCAPHPAALLRMLIASSMVLLLGTATLAQTQAQSKKEAELKTVHGSVVDKDENPVPTSVVYLKNLGGNQAVRTYISDNSGNYRFSGLDPNVDYEIHAEHGANCSASRKISSFDSRRDIEYVLKLTKTNCRK
jgi:hypothetical protein